MQSWAAQELRASNLGDARLDRRLVKIVDCRD
ncbi:MAG: transposase DNA-binding-containing protein, partial [Thermosynechococcaceae cyanobacterium]